MYIKHVTIQNYRNFGDPPFSIELKPFTLILGENNIGKTNLLNALGLLFSQEIIIFKKRSLEIDDLNYKSLNDFKLQICDLAMKAEEISLPEVSVEVVLTDFNKEQEAVVADWFIDKKLTEAKITYLFSPRAKFLQEKDEWIVNQRNHLSSKIDEAKENNNKLTLQQKSNLIDFPISEYRYIIYGSDDTSNDCDPYYLRMLKMEFLDALRDAKQELMAGGDYRLLYRILNQRDESKYVDIKDLLNQLEEAVSQNENLLNIKQEVSELLDKVSLQTIDEDNSIDFSFSSPESSEILKKLSMVYGSNPINVARNGLGRNNLLYISLVLSHLSAKDSRGSETCFRLIAIEEPEAHLHPHLQDHISSNIESVRSGGNADEEMQLLLTSHSTHIVAKLDLENTVIIYSEKSDGEINRLKSHYVLANLEKETKSVHYLSKYLDATKSRLFFSRKVILVEGIAEQILIPTLYGIYSGISLEKAGCNVINVNGVAFAHFLKIIRSGYFIKCLVLTDSDSDTETAERAVNLKNDYDQKGIIRIEISRETTFEKDLIQANNSKKEKNTILNALKATRPRIGKTMANSLKEDDILILEDVFKAIEKYKSEFSFNLLAELDKNSAFKIPDYIKQGFEFLS